MKFLSLTLIALMVSVAVNAQILGSFFSQKQENRKLLAQQIAALEVYKGFLKTGYKIVSTGIGIIGKIKKGDFDLHRDFFGALKLTNPKIKNYYKVAEIFALNVGAVAQLKNAAKKARPDLFPGWQHEYIKQIIERTLEVMAGTIDELAAIITDNQISLKDDERIERIDQLYNQTVEHYNFTRYFNAEISITRKIKAQDTVSIQGIQTLTGINTN